MSRIDKNTIREEVDEGSWWIITRGPMVDAGRPFWAEPNQGTRTVEDRRYRDMIVQVLALDAWPNVLCAVVWDSGEPTDRVEPWSAGYARKAAPVTAAEILAHKFQPPGAPKQVPKGSIARRLVVPFKNIQATQVPPEWVAKALGCTTEELFT
jgi:hypothetical protein